ncbi:MAG: Ig-like domain-containing protein, partial [Tannerella sp.]|nr:Ig-like domain-containing protein [Tannerella sp.]
MQKMFLFLVSVLVCGMLTTSCGEDDKGVALTDFTLSPTEIKKPVGEIQKVTATAVPSDATDVVYTWTSANENVATVNTEGIVRITGVGTTTVTATSGTISKTVQVEGTIVGITLK